MSVSFPFSVDLVHSEMGSKSVIHMTILNVLCEDFEVLSKFVQHNTKDPFSAEYHIDN